jgi:TonB family protein
MTNRTVFLGVAFVLLSAGAAAAQSSRAECDGRSVRLHAVPGSHVMPPYPAISQRMGEQGESVLSLTIGPDGGVIQADVLRSSGSKRLDDAAQDFIRRSWRWQATACRAAVTQVTVTWRLIEPQGR